MTDTNTQHPAPKAASQMLQSFKAAANPYYHAEFGLALNNVNFWKKFVDMQYIIVWAGGNSFTFAGEDARNVLYNLGDRDGNKFRTLTEQEQIALYHHLNGTTPAPVQEEQPQPNTETYEVQPLPLTEHQ